MRVLLAILCVIGCAEANMSSSFPRNKDKDESTTTDEPVESEDKTELEPEPPLGVPKSWSNCWVSGRLSSALALSIAGVDDTPPSPIVSGSTEAEKFSIVNPVADGTCQAHWGNLLSLQPGDDLWELTAFFSADRNSHVKTVVSCIADITTDCRCFSIIYDDTINIAIDLCQNQTCSGGKCIWGDVYEAGVHNTSIAPDGKECAPMSQLSKQWGIWAINEGEALVEDTIGGDKCRIDLEPFEPEAIDTDWYGHETRDWGVVTCSEEITATTSCRCYSNLFKSTSQADARSEQFTFNRCMKCTDNNCQRVIDTF